MTTQAPDATVEALREALAEWDAIEGSDLADQFRAFIAAGKMADAIRAALPGCTICGTTEGTSEADRHAWLHP